MRCDEDIVIHVLDNQSQFSDYAVYINVLVTSRMHILGIVARELDE